MDRGRGPPQAAAAGGFTTVVCMPNTSPRADNAGTIQFIMDAAGRDAVVRRYSPTGCITIGMKGHALAPIGSLKRAGVVAITDDGECVQSNELMRQFRVHRDVFNPALTNVFGSHVGIFMTRFKTALDNPA